MTAEQFAYWFQGFAELSKTPPTQEQWDSMREHVATVFVKVTPRVVGPNIAAPARPTDKMREWADLMRKQQWPGTTPQITC